MNNNTVKLPISDHGLHRHDINNVSMLGTLNFFEPVPYVVKEYYKDESIDLKLSLFNRAVVPLNDPAMVTGHINVRGFYVPKRFVFKGWHDFDQRVKHTFSDGTSAYLSHCRYVYSDLMSAQFVGLSSLVTLGSSSSYDFIFVDSGGVSNYYVFTTLGATVQKIFNALGYCFSWNSTVASRKEQNIMKILGYVKVMLDHYSPKQYANQVAAYQYAKEVLEADTLASLHVDELHLINMVAHYSYCFYENSIFDIAFDNPVGPNVGPNDIVIKDNSNENTYPLIVSDNPANVNSPNTIDVMPSAGVPFIGGIKAPSGTTNNALGVVTQYVLDALQNLSNFLNRHRLAGGKLIDRFLASRGVKLSREIARESYYLGNFVCPLEVSDVEDNTSNNLGELAGKMVASSKDVNIQFKANFDDDGYFYVITSIVPDADLPVFVDPDVDCISPLDFYHGEYDKQGPAAIPSSVVYYGNNGVSNASLDSQVFGFLNMYYHRALFSPRLFGDFRVPLRGGNTYSQYHSFRYLDTYFYNNSNTVNHSYDFLRAQLDSVQYNRLFNTTKNDTFMLLMRADGNMMLKKLPLGDSYDWDDDEFNQKVTLVRSGNVQ